jgi:hypothetical protein
MWELIGWCPFVMLKGWRGMQKGWKGKRLDRCLAVEAGVATIICGGGQQFRVEANAMSALAPLISSAATLVSRVD